MKALDLFEQLGARLSAPDILIDASIPLNLSGESIRGRICTFHDETGQEWALRPDLTLPVLLSELACGEASTGPQMRCYSGPVFRLPAWPGEPVEYDQTGLERYGYPSDPADDIEMLRIIAQACAAEGVQRCMMQCGDLAVFPAFVDALDQSETTASALKRAFRQQGGVSAYLAGRQAHAHSGGLSERLAGLPRPELEAVLRDLFALSGLHPVGDRSAEEIVEGLIRKQADATDSGLTDTVRKLLLDVLSVDTSLMQAADEIRDLAHSSGLTDMQTVTDRLETRCQLLQESLKDTPVEQVRYATRFGRRFTYYDGFVFELSDLSPDGPSRRAFAAGGRYDSLFGKLSEGRFCKTAIGGVIIPHRIADPMGVQG